MLRKNNEEYRVQELKTKFNLNQNKGEWDMKKEQLGFPSIGETLSFIISAMGINKEEIKKRLQRLSNEKDFDLERFPELLIKFKTEISKIFKNKDVATEFTTIVNNFLIEYKKLVLEEMASTREISLKFATNSLMFSIINEFKSLLDRLIRKKILFTLPKKKLWFIPDITAKNNIQISAIKNIFKFYMEIKQLKSFDQLSTDFSMATHKDKRAFDKTHKANIYKWSHNKSEMNLSHFFSYLEQYEKDEKLLLNMKILFFIARLSDHVFKVMEKSLEKEYTATFVKNIKELYISFEDINDRQLNSLYEILENKKDPIAFIKEYEIFLNKNYGKYLVKIFYIHFQNLKSLDEEVAKRKNILFKMSSLLNNQLSLKNNKKSTSQEEGKTSLNELNKSKYIEEFESFYLFLEARFYLLSGDFSQSLQKYLEAFDKGKYILGNHLKNVIREAFLLSAYLEKKSKMKELYKFGKYFDLFGERYEDVEKWLIRENKYSFFNQFNKECFFPQANLEKFNKKKIKIDRRYFRTDDDEISLELKNANKKIKISDTTESQLFSFAVSKKVDSVEKLIKSGADVNFKREDNATALLVSLQTVISGLGNNLKKGRKIANMILDANIMPETINSITSLKKISVIHETVALGEKNLLEKMLKKGGDSNLKATLDDISPLYYALNCYHAKISLQNVNFEKLSYYSQLNREALFLEERIKNSMETISMIPDSLLKEQEEIFKKHKKEYLKIIDLLLNYNADVDLIHNNNYTPLLFSAEVGKLSIFKKLFQKSKNKFLKTSFGDNIFSISILYKNYNISKFILDNLKKEELVEILDRNILKKTFANLIENKTQQKEEMLAKILAKLDEADIDYGWF